MLAQLATSTALALAVAGSAQPAWNKQAPNDNADKVVRLFRDVCVNHLGRSGDMRRAVDGSGARFRSTYAGNAAYGPVWDSPYGRISATDHRHNHDGDECRIEIRRPVAPEAAAAIAALRRHGIVAGKGEAAEFGATVFEAGELRIFIRYNVPESATGVTAADAGLTLLIQRPAG